MKKYALKITVIATQRNKDAEGNVFTAVFSSKSLQAAKAKATRLANEQELFSYSIGETTYRYTGKDIRWKQWSEEIGHLDRRDILYVVKSAETYNGDTEFETINGRVYAYPTRYHIHLVLEWKKG